MKLSRNFSLRELTKSATAERSGIDNNPKDLEHLVNMTHLAIHILQPCRDEFGVITVNSGYRSPDLNKAVGGSDKSQHCHGQAADFESYSISNPDLAQWIVDNLEIHKIILDIYNGKDTNSVCINCSYSLMENRKKVMTALKPPGGKVEYKEGLIR